MSIALLFVQYGYFVFLFHDHDDSVVLSRRPVVVPVQSPAQNLGHPTGPPNWKSQSRRCVTMNSSGLSLAGMSKLFRRIVPLNMTRDVLPDRYNRNHASTMPRKPNCRSSWSTLSDSSWSTVSKAAVKSSWHKAWHPTCDPSSHHWSSGGSRGGAGGAMPPPLAAWKKFLPVY